MDKTDYAGIEISVKELLVALRHDPHFRAYL
jgi:hypothetical protein